MSGLVPLLARRPAIRAKSHAIVAGHPLAALAGMRILEQGGNAIDAGVTAGLVLNVVQPDMTGLGGVAPAVVYKRGATEPYVLDGLGTWPRAAIPDWFLRRGFNEVPLGILSTVVPAAIDAWLAALALSGSLTFEEVVAPAIELAAGGFQVHQMLHNNLLAMEDQLAMSQASADIYLPGGRVPQVGETLRQADLARTLERLVDVERAARSRGRVEAIQAIRDEFYRGEIADTIVSFVQSEGGLLTREDMSRFAVVPEKALHTEYRGHTVYSCDTWCQGPTVLQSLNLLEGFDLRSYGHNSAQSLHLIVEAVKIAFSDRHFFYGDPKWVDVPIRQLLSKEYADRRRGEISMDQAFPGMPAPVLDTILEMPEPTPGIPGPDTSYVCVVDSEGNAYSATPSDPVSDAPIVPGLGIITSARGKQSWLDPDHPAALGPGRRPRLTPNPGMVFRDGELMMPYGSPGGDAQPQAMLQFLLNLIDYEMPHQEAVEAPRVVSFSFPVSETPHPYRPGLLNVEAPIEVADDLVALGHDVEVWSAHHPLAGSVCAIHCVDDSTKVAAADSRHMAYALGW